MPYSALSALENNFPIQRGPTNQPSAKLPNFTQRVGDRRLDFSWSIAAQLLIHGLKPANQIQHRFARIGSAGGGAKMRAATERPVGVNQNSVRFPV